ncbi:MAG: hypothetical protein JWO22_2597, partial [Frankiales bacterium]|nr:hypothetical protein [Frankiales bacterium]
GRDVRLATAPAPHAGHTGHVLLATGFVVVALAAVALGEHVTARCAARDAERGATRSLRPRTPAALLVVTSCGAAAGAIHLAVTPSHWAQAPVYGVFFLVAGVTQLVWAALLLVRCTPALLGLNLAANLGLALLWLQTRTSGVPLGPAAGVRDRIGPVDLTCAAVELAAVVTAARILSRRAARRRVPGTVTALAATGLASSAAANCSRVPSGLTPR